MHKRSLTELRKLRKRDKLLWETIEEIKKLNDEELHNYILERLIENCIYGLKEIHVREEFLRNLESPDDDSKRDEILKKILRQ